MAGLNMSSLREEWDLLDKEYEELETHHKEYIRILEDLGKIKTKCSKAISHQLYREKQISQALKYCQTNGPDEHESAVDLRKSISLRKRQLKEIQNDLPKSNGLYLKVILGNVSVALIKDEEKLRYKEEYERFKLIVACIILILSVVNITVFYRVTASILHFLQVWYYCTLTIRESILVINGSRIKGWWRAHHFLATIQAGVIIVWPDGEIYGQFRRQLMWYTCYISLIQFLQTYYQQGCLYRLRALGERYNMDITIEGFHSWMWRGLTFLLPFLYFGYFFQLYNAITLYRLSHHPDCTEWQVFVSAILFFGIFLGNSFTTTRVLHQKLSEKFQFRNLLIRKKSE